MKQILLSLALLIAAPVFADTVFIGTSQEGGLYYTPERQLGSDRALYFSIESTTTSDETVPLILANADRVTVDVLYAGSGTGGKVQTKTLLTFDLAYDGQTANFTDGETVTGGTSGATAVVYNDTDGGASGTLEVVSVRGTFSDNEALTGSSTGIAVVNGTISVNDSDWTDWDSGLVTADTTKAMPVIPGAMRLANGDTSGTRMNVRVTPVR